MKTLPPNLASHYAQGTRTLAHFLRITRRDSTVLGVTSLDRAVTVDGLEYVPGMDISTLVASAGLAVDNLEVTVLPDDDITAEDLQAGLWDQAEFVLFECNYTAPSDGINILKRGWTGEAQANRGAYTIEFRGLTQALQQAVGAVTSKTCRARFADAPTPVPDALCGLTAADWTESGTITAVTDRRIFSDASRAEPEDYFGEGMLTFTSGENDGLSGKVKSFAAGVFTLQLPMPFAVGVGDTYEVIAGCRKRLEEDCRDKFSNVLNFQGEPHLPGIDALTKPPGSVE